MDIFPTLVRSRGSFYPFNIPYSGLFSSDSYLNWTPSVSGDSTNKWSFSAWIKVERLSADASYRYILEAGTSAATVTLLQLSDTDSFRLYSAFGGSGIGHVDTNAVFRDVSSWYHVLAVFDAVIATLTVFVNGVELSKTTTTAIGSSGHQILSNVLHVIGKSALSAGYYFSGNLAEAHMVDNQTLTPSSFGEYVGDIWVPKRYTGSYGTNGFYLDFADSGDLGKDVSGNGNDWTNSGVVRSEDSPTNNFCVLNKIDTGSTGAITGGGLVVSGGVAKVTMKPTSGKWYYEKDGVGVQYDADSSGQFDPSLAAGTYNFGATAFSNSIPAGYKKLCSENLPKPEILDPTKGFDVKTWLGNGTARTISGLQFSDADSMLVWIKSRTYSGSSHVLIDAVRGAGYSLRSSGTSAEYYDLSEVSAIDESSFNLGIDSNVNWLAHGYVGWVFNMIAKYGMDIVTYTGTGANRTISHNLGAAPELIIIKNRDSAEHWIVGSNQLTSWVYYLLLADINAETAAANMFNSTAPTGSVFSLGTNIATNENGSDFVAYLFRSIPDFLKIGSYAGNSSVDGPFIYTGFRPKYVVLRNIGSAGYWKTIDSARDLYNVSDSSLWLTTTDTEYSADAAIDILSNGFKLKVSGAGVNGTGGTYLYMAFAEAPFKYANAR